MITVIIEFDSNQQKRSAIKLPPFNYPNRLKYWNMTLDEMIDELGGGEKPE